MYSRAIPLVGLITTGLHIVLASAMIYNITRGAKATADQMESYYYDEDYNKFTNLGMKYSYYTGAVLSIGLLVLCMDCILTNDRQNGFQSGRHFDGLVSSILVCSTIF